MSFQPSEIATAGVRSTKESLILAAERLFGNHGVDGVSLRQIVAEAGAANNSAVQYHFGSKDGLVQAILEYRIPQLMQRRRLLAARYGSSDLRSAWRSICAPARAGGDRRQQLPDLPGTAAGRPLESHPFSRLPAASKSRMRTSWRKPRAISRRSRNRYDTAGSARPGRCAFTPAPTASARAGVASRHCPSGCTCASCSTGSSECSTHPSRRRLWLPLARSTSRRR